MNEFVIAADLGTSSLKAAVVRIDGRTLATARSGYGTRIAPGGRTEQDPADWLRALVAAVGELAASVDVRAARALVVAGQMSAALLVDDALEPLHPCLIWSDQRARDIAATVAHRLGADTLHRRTGNPATPTYTAPKLGWLARESPALFGRARAFLQPKDFLVARLTGRTLTDTSDASCTGLMNLAAGTWDPELFAAYGVPERLAPDILASSDIAGPLIGRMAGVLGLPEGLPVVVGGGDGPATAAGVGALSAGDGYVSLGTSAWASFVGDDPSVGADPGLATFAHVLPGRFVATGAMQSAGASLEWGATLLGMSPEAFAAVALDVPAPTGDAPLFLPYLQGERTPYWTATPAGAFLGLARDHDRTAVASAVMEGVLLHLRLILERFEGARDAGAALPVAGAFGRSSAFLPRLAAALDRSVVPMHDAEHATAVGAALVAFTGLGLVDERALSDGWFLRGDPIAPAARGATGNARYRLFRDAWHANESIHRDLAALAPRGFAPTAGA